MNACSGRLTSRKPARRTTRTTSDARRALLLLTIPFSHYCEKARWALDRAGAPYTEEGHAPMLHWRRSFAVGGNRTVPVLVDDGTVLRDSTDILHHLDARLPPHHRLFPVEEPLRAEVMELEEQFDRALGPAARRYMYFLALPHKKFVAKMLAGMVPTWERAVVQGAYPLAAALLRRGLRVDAAGAERSRLKLMEVFGQVEKRLADGRRYLCGGRFTAADLAFASLASPLVVPPNQPGGFPPPGDWPADVDAAIRGFRDMPAGRFVLDLYTRDRRTRVA